MLETTKRRVLRTDNYTRKLLVLPYPVVALVVIMDSAFFLFIERTVGLIYISSKRICAKCEKYTNALGLVVPCRVVSYKNRVFLSFMP
jgi:hypothetical protein